MVKFLDNNNSGFAAWNASRNTTAKPKSKLGSFLWWLILFIGSWWLISMWTAPKNAPTPTDADVAIISATATDMPAREISSDKIGADLRGLRISNVALLDYAATSGEKSERVKLLGAENDFLEIGLNATGTTAPDVNTVWQDTADNKMTWRNSDGVVFTRDISVDGYLVTITDSVENNTARDISFAPYARIVRGSSQSSAGVAMGAVTNTNSRVRYVDWGKMAKKSYVYSTTNGKRLSSSSSSNI